jgi:Ca2+-binding RTX toxin-like protein
MKKHFSKHDPSCCCAMCMSEHDGNSPHSHTAGDGGDGGGGGGGGMPVQKPVYSLEDINTALTTNFASGKAREWNTKTVYYYIATDPAIVPSDLAIVPSAVGWHWKEGYDPGLMSGRTATASLAFELWDDLIDINLEQTTTSKGDISIAYSTTIAEQDARTLGDVDGGQIVEERIWIASDRPGHTGTVVDFSYRTSGFYDYVHEIGHALGLSHPGPYDSSGGHVVTYADDAEYAQDIRMYTSMSYNGGWVAGADGRLVFVNDGEGPAALYPQTPMLHDIYAIQLKYGADPNTRLGDTIYGFGSTAGRDVFDFDLNSLPRLTIWDAGGDHDTLDASGYDGLRPGFRAVDQLINLSPGTYSNIGNLTENVAIAFDCWIENAIGGGGDDSIRGNIRDNRLVGNDGIDTIFGDDGNDTIDGGLGADIMAGGNHNDTFYVDNLGDYISEFASGGYDTAKVSISGYTLAPYVERGEVINPSRVDFTLSGNDLDNVLVGSGGRDQLFGGANRDTIRGLDGNDTIDGGPGGDQMYGGIGNDTYTADDPGDRIFEDAGGGKDTAIVFWSGFGVPGPGSTGYILPANVEVGRVGTAGGQVINGNGLPNTLYGGPGRDTLTGGGGVDELHGGGDNDWLNGGAQADTLFGEAGYDTFAFWRGEANGDILADFNGNGAAAGDQIRLYGYAAGATFTQTDSTHLDIFSGGVHEVITLRIATTLDPSDSMFVP